MNILTVNCYSRSDVIFAHAQTDQVAVTDRKYAFPLHVDNI